MAVIYATGTYGILLVVGELILSLVWTTLMQQKAVDLTQAMNPEKQGSVYDLKF